MWAEGLGRSEVEGRVAAWARKKGVRALLMSLGDVVPHLWQESITEKELTTPAQVTEVYKRAILTLHPLGNLDLRSKDANAGVASFVLKQLKQAAQKEGSKNMNAKLNEYDDELTYTREQMSEKSHKVAAEMTAHKYTKAEFEGLAKAADDEMKRCVVTVAAALEADRILQEQQMTQLQSQRDEAMELHRHLAEEHQKAVVEHEMATEEHDKAVAEHAKRLEEGAKEAEFVAEQKAINTLLAMDNEIQQEKIEL